MSVVPIRPDVEAPEQASDFGYRQMPVVPVAEIETPEPESNKVDTAVSRWPTLVELVLGLLAYLLIAIGWVAGLISVPCNWCWGALRTGWDSARRGAGL